MMNTSIQDQETEIFRRIILSCVVPLALLLLAMAVAGAAQTCGKVAE